MSLYPMSGTSVAFEALPGWGFQLAHDGDRTYGVWSVHGKNVFAVVAGDA